MEQIITDATIEVRRLAGECLNIVRALPKTKENQEAEGKLLLLWRDLKDLAKMLTPDVY